MVDFQSRDTRRDSTNEDPETEHTDDPDDGDPSGAEHGDTAHEDADDHDNEQHDDHDHHAHDDHDHHAHDDHDHHAHDDHDHHAHDIDQLGIAVVTVSSTRSIEEDGSGAVAIEAIEAAGHEVSTRELIADDYDGIQSGVDALVGRKDVDVVVTSGGTGVTPDDVTIEAVEQLFDKRLPGFGELFRSLSREEIGTRVVGTRATAGIADGVPVFCLPGSENAVRLGVEEIVLEEAGHLAGLAQRE